MRKQIIGEEVLRLLMTPDRAAAIVGDLEESGVSSARFWLAIGSNILHAITPAVLTAAAKGWLAQFAFVIPFGLFMAFAFFLFPGEQWRSVGAVSLLFALGSQIPAALWISRRPEQQRLLICALIVAADCVTGLLRINAVSVNMAIWSIPLVVAAVVIDRRWRKCVA